MTLSHIYLSLSFSCLQNPRLEQVLLLSDYALVQLFSALKPLDNWHSRVVQADVRTWQWPAHVYLLRILWISQVYQYSAHFKLVVWHSCSLQYFCLRFVHVLFSFLLLSEKVYVFHDLAIFHWIVLEDLLMEFGQFSDHQLICLLIESQWTLAFERLNSWRAFVDELPRSDSTQLQGWRVDPWGWKQAFFRIKGSDNRVCSTQRGYLSLKNHWICCVKFLL